MRNRVGRQSNLSGLQWISLFLLLFSVILSTIQIARFSRLHTTFPEGMTIAGIPVGKLDRQNAAQRLLEAYSNPVELRYNENSFLLDPSVVGFALDLESMLAAADLERTKQSFWTSFWDYLWGRPRPASDIPLRASYSELRLRTYLEDEIAPRYDQPAVPSLPVPGTVEFQPGELGTALDIDRTILPIENALRSIKQRNVTLPLKRTLPPKPSINNLKILLKQTINLAEFDGIVGFYFLNLENAQEIHFAYQDGIEFPTNPDIAFTTASIIKIPILVSVYNRLDDVPDQETTNLIEKMIIESGNETADWLMQRIIDSYRAPLFVSEDLQAIGLENTFLAGHFYLGAPILDRFDTPANQRVDVTTNPDPYNQTTPSDIGMLLQDLYVCAEDGGGTLIAAFPGKIKQEECQSMISYLTKNKMPSLIEAGIPDGTRIAHKHGWVTNNGVINLLGDAGLVYTPGGDYVLAIFFYHPVQVIWDSASSLMGQLSRAIYNFYNLPTP
jgi:beta-lactamase class A